MHTGKSSFRINIWICIILATVLIRHARSDDGAIMQELAKGLNGTGWSGDDPCQWSGVRCDPSGKITSLDLHARSIAGQLPPDLNQLSSLQTLNLQKNKLSGSLPSLSNLTSLKDVYFGSNSFSSVPTDFLSGLTSLRNFSIDDNPNLGPWTIPNSLTDSTQLASFSAMRANIVGPIPDIFGSFPSLTTLALSYNNITGPLPQSFAKSGIQNLWLNNQDISGRIDVLASMSQVRQAWLHVNNFSGSIPDLSGCIALYDLQLRDNQLTGVIPASLASLPMLSNLTLQNNDLQGPVPSFPKSVLVNLGTTNSFCNTSPGPCDPQVTTLLQVAGELGYPSTLAQSWRGNDACNNWDFITCDSGSVSVINFAKQGFGGTISPAIANLTSLRTLIFNDNHFSGPIPSSLTSLKNLKTLDVSNNNISGKLPDFGPDVTVKTSGNPFIGVVLPPSGSPQGSYTTPVATSPPTSPLNGERKASKWIIAVILVAAVIIVVVLGFVLYKRFVHKPGGTKKKPHKVGSARIISGASSQSSDFNGSDGNNKPIPIEVLREATNGFREKNILGHGGFGVVYHGVLDGRQVAVKRMLSSVFSNKGLKEFEAEIEVLKKVKHRNLVELVGSCVNGNERLLVFEYMPQGTLGQHLFSWQRELPPLSWKQRISIALDVARGVEYLHSLARQSFIHRDLKPSNILLGNDMRAKVSDFGLVKSASDGKHSIETRLAGTFGYLAPEYASTGRVTTKIDVFAFGVILMELITGQKALDDDRPEDQTHLQTWFRKVIINNENIRSCLDPTLEPDGETFESICKVAELAAHCTSKDPLQRPIMGHAVNVLSPLVEQWMPAAKQEDESFGINPNMSLPEVLQRWRASDGQTTNSDLFAGNTTGFTGSTGMA